MRNDMLGAAVFEPIGADCRVAAEPLVDADREVEFLRFRPQRIVGAVVELAVVVTIGAHEPHLLDREFHRLHRQHRNAEQPVRVGLAEIGHPAVVGAETRAGEVRLLDRPHPQAHRRVQEDGVNTVEVQIRDARVRIEAALPALGVLHVLDRILAAPDDVDRAGGADTVKARKRPANEPHHLLAMLVDEIFGGLVAIGGVNIALPQIHRFQHVAVGIDDIVSAAH